jgi:Flp pilus assembly pilin Flp
MRRKLKRFAANQTGVTAIEASLVAAIMSIAAVAAVESFGDRSVVDYAQAAIGWFLG